MNDDSVNNDERGFALEDEAPLAEEEALEQEETLEAFDEEDDDLAVLASHDEVVASAEAMTAVTQGEDFMLWNIEGLYDENTNRPYKARDLKRNPPVLHIENKRDEEMHFADFVLTREFARTLEKGLRTTNRAYSGVSDAPPLSKEGIRVRIEEFAGWLREHVVGASIIGALILFVIVFGFIL